MADFVNLVRVFFFFFGGGGGGGGGGRGRGVCVFYFIILAFKGALRDFVQSPHCFANLTPTRMLKWPGRNCVQIMCITSSAYHVQHVMCHVVQRDSSATKFDSLNCVYFSYISLAKPLLMVSFCLITYLLCCGSSWFYCLSFHLLLVVGFLVCVFDMQFVENRVFRLVLCIDLSVPEYSGTCYAFHSILSFSSLTFHVLSSNVMSTFASTLHFPPSTDLYVISIFL